MTPEQKTAVEALRDLESLHAKHGDSESADLVLAPLAGAWHAIAAELPEALLDEHFGGSRLLWAFRRKRDDAVRESILGHLGARRGKASQARWRRPGHDVDGIEVLVEEGAVLRNRPDTWHGLPVTYTVRPKRRPSRRRARAA